MATIVRYRREMLKHLPVKDDNSLLKYHKLAIKRAMDDFNVTTLMKEGFNSLRLDEQEQPVLPSLEEAIREAFMDMIDLNWKKCEEVCRETLGRVEKRILPVEVEDRSENYWSSIKRLHEEYNADIGEYLCSKMQFIRLEYLERRQDTDFDILMEVIRKQATEAGPNAGVESGVTAGTEGDVSSDATSDATTSTDAAEVSEDRVHLLSEEETPQTEPLLNESISGASEEHFEKELKLRMTWARIIIFWKYWIDCRKETIDILNSVLYIFEGEEVPADETIPGEVFLKRIFSDNGFENYQLQFAHKINRDFSCYKVLLRKLTEFLDLVKSSEYVGAFGVEAKDLFLNVSTFQTNISVKQPETCRGFEICENIISREQEGLGETAKLLACTSRPLLHLKDLLRKLSDEGRLNRAGIEGAINDIQQEETDMSTMFSESLLSFKSFLTKVNCAAEQLRNAIDVWLPIRKDSITEIKEIIGKMNKTTKDVAITQAVSSSVGILGGLTAIIGLALVPVTFGASLLPLIIGGVSSGLGAATAIGSSVTEIVIEKGEMKKAKACIEADKVLFEKVAKSVENLNRNYSMLLRYVPEDELKSFISVMTNTQSTPMQSSSLPFQIDPRIAVPALRFGSFVGKAALMPVTRMAYAGTIAISKAVLVPLAHSVAAIGVVLDFLNLGLAGRKLLTGAKSEHAEKLEDAVNQMEEEKVNMENYFPTMS